MNDFKDIYQLRAEEISHLLFGVGFYELSQLQREDVYDKAVTQVAEDFAAAGDNLRKGERER